MAVDKNLRTSNAISVIDGKMENMAEADRVDRVPVFFDQRHHLAGRFLRGFQMASRLIIRL